MTFDKIANELNIPRTLVTNLFREKGNKDEIAKVPRRRVAIDLLAMGISPKDIYTKTFGYSSDARDSFIQEFIERIFDNAMTYDEIIAHDWTNQVGGWIEFYGLVRGEDY